MLGLFGKNKNVSAEILRVSGSEVHILYKGKEVVVFPKYRSGLARGYFAKEIIKIFNTKKR